MIAPHLIFYCDFLSAPFSSDECVCPPDESVDCLMSSSMGKAVWRFSNCSQLVLDSFNGNCLNNQPKSLYGDPVCGNGFVEEGEECDCGTEEVRVLESCWIGTWLLLDTVKHTFKIRWRK